MNMLQIILLAHLGAVGASAVVLAVRVAARHGHAGPLAAGRSASRTGHRRSSAAAAAAAAAVCRGRHRGFGRPCQRLPWQSALPDPHLPLRGAELIHGGP